MGKRCRAMVAAGISNPESSEGIDFCVNHCPYKFCVVFEGPGKRNVKYRKAKERANLARALRAHGVSKSDIALMLRVTKAVIEQYLKVRNRYPLGEENTTVSLGEHSISETN